MDSPLLAYQAVSITPSLMLSADTTSIPCNLNCSTLLPCGALHFQCFWLATRDLGIQRASAFKSSVAQGHLECASQMHSKNALQVGHPELFALWQSRCKRTICRNYFSPYSPCTFHCRPLYELQGTYAYCPVHFFMRSMVSLPDHHLPHVC